MYKPALGGLVAALVLTVLFALSYVGALHDPEPHGVPVGVVGPLPQLAGTGFAPPKLYVAAAPLPRGDSRGLTLFYASIAFVFGGYFAATVVTTLLGPRSPRRDAGPWLPTGAGFSAVYFDGTAIGGRLLVLALYAVVGAAVTVALGWRRGLRAPELEVATAAAV